MREAEEDDDLAGGVETLVARLGHACSRSRPQELLCHLVGHNAFARLNAIRPPDEQLELMGASPKLHPACSSTTAATRAALTS
jgi:hypothetical protein